MSCRWEVLGPRNDTSTQQAQSSVEAKDSIFHGQVPRHLVEAAGLGHHLWSCRPQASGAMLPT